MNKPELQALDGILDALLLEVGQQVTANYQIKHGVWEGMSVENARSRDSARQAILQWVADEVVGEDQDVRLNDSEPDYQIYIARRNEHRAEQRQILKAHGWKQEGKDDE